MSLALYRKYRPQTFGDIVGQQHIKVTLEREVAGNKIAHAYLFSGPRGTGKTSIARIFAKAVNCVGKETRKQGNKETVDKGESAHPPQAGQSGEPCNECVACKTITEGRALDVIEIDAASHTGVDTVRETIVETAKFAPSSLKFKIFIIDEAHMLSTSAWNALLKIMEEPPKHVLFVLATTEVHKVPATIISRCQHFAFHRVSNDELVKLLENIAVQEKIKITKPVLDMVARQSEGCVRDAEGVLEQLFSLGEDNINEDTASLILPRTSLSSVLELIAILQTTDVRKGLELVNRLMEQGADLTRFTDELLEILRNVLIIKVAGGNIAPSSLSAQTVNQLISHANSFSTARLLDLIEKFSKARQDFRQAVIPQLPLEVAIIESCGYKKENDKKDENNKPASQDLSVKNLNISKENLDKGSSASVAMEAELPDMGDPVRGNGLNKAPEPIKKTNGFAQLTIEEIKAKWNELINRAQAENPTLPFLLSTGYPVEVLGDTLRVGVQYSMHCDKLNEHKCRTALESLLAEVYQSPLKVKGIIVAPPKKQNDDIADVLEAFGGKVVG